MDIDTIASLRKLQDLPEEETAHTQEHSSERIILFIILTPAALSLAYSCVKFLQEYMWRRYRVDLCSMCCSRRDDEQIDQDRASAQEAQRQFIEQELEARKLATRKERRSWYEPYLRPFTTVATKEDFFYAREMDNGPKQAQKTNLLHQLRQMSTVSSSDEEGEAEEDLEHGQTIDPIEPVLCDQSDQSAHLFLRLPVQDTCGKHKYVDAHCAICVSDYEEGEKVVWSGLECKHAFHDECILAWLCKGKKRCPICRHWFVPAEKIEDQKMALGASLRRPSETSTSTPSTERDDPSESSVSETSDLEVSFASPCESENLYIQSADKSGRLETTANLSPEEEPSSRNGSAELGERISPNHTPCSDHEV